MPPKNPHRKSGQRAQKPNISDFATVPGEMKNVARLLRVSKSKVYQERKAGRLRTVSFGRAVRVRPRDVQKYINAATGVR